MILLWESFSQYINDVNKFLIIEERLYFLESDVNKLNKIYSLLLNEKLKILHLISLDAVKVVKYSLEKKPQEKEISSIQFNINKEIHKRNYLAIENRLQGVKFLLKKITNKRTLLLKQYLMLKKNIINEQKALKGKVIKIDKKILNLAKNVSSIDELLNNINAELTIGLLTKISEQFEDAKLSNFIKPISGKILYNENWFYSEAHNNQLIFAINDGIVLFTSKFKSKSIIIMMHNFDYKSVIYGDFNYLVQIGEYIKKGQIIATVNKKLNLTHINFAIYYKDKKNFSTKTVDNFVENFMK